MIFMSGSFETKTVRSNDMRFTSERLLQSVRDKQMLHIACKTPSNLLLLRLSSQRSGLINLEYMSQEVQHPNVRNTITSCHLKCLASWLAWTSSVLTSLQKNLGELCSPSRRVNFSAVMAVMQLCTAVVIVSSSIDWPLADPLSLYQCSFLMLPQQYIAEGKPAALTIRPVQCSGRPCHLSADAKDLH